MKQKVVIEEKDWKNSKYRTKEWEDSVEILKWEHNYETKKYIIHFQSNNL